MKGNKFLQLVVDVLGRGSITLLAVIAINKSTWYQNINGGVSLTDPFGWLVSFGVIGCIVWLVAPVFALNVKEVSE